MIRWEKAICKHCQQDILKDYGGYVDTERLAKLMESHDKVIHQNSYELTPAKPFEV